MRTKKGYGSDPRVTPKLLAALVGLVEEGLSIEEAAAKAGLKPATLQTSLRKKHVAAKRSELRALLRDNGRDKAFHRVAGLIDGAKSEYVALDASKLVLGLAGESPSTVAPAPPLGNNGGVGLVLILPTMTPDAQQAAMTFVGSGVAIATRPPAIEAPREAWPGWRAIEGQAEEPAPVPATETGRADR